MTKEIRKELNQAKRLYKSGKKQDAYEIYNRHYLENPEELDYWDTVRYCWCIYYLYIKDSNDEDEITEHVEMVTDLVKQTDLNEAPVCVYAQCVFRAIMFFKANEDWEYVLYWLDKLNPDLLSEKQRKYKEITYPSKKEEYYSFKSRAYIKCEDYEDCIEVSKKALSTLSKFALNGDIWHKFRIAKSLKELGQSKEALTYLEDVVEVQKDWFVYKEIAENCCNLNDYDNALKYAVEAVLAKGSPNHKINVYYLIYNLLKDSNPDLALKHAELFLALKLESGAGIPDEIEELGIDEENLDVETLEWEIKNHWIESEFNRSNG